MVMVKTGGENPEQNIWETWENIWALNEASRSLKLCNHEKGPNYVNY